MSSTGRKARRAWQASRRQAVTGLAASLGAVMLPHARAQQPATRLVVPPWDAVPGCTPSPADRAGQGPFFIHDAERNDDASLYREDIRGQYDPAAGSGTELQLHLRVLASGANCGTSPLRDVEVYLWHCDAQGYYSGFGEPGEQQPDVVYRFTPGQNDLDNTDRFCRGVVLTNADGVASFRSVFPGWYNGRDVHIHVMLLRKGSAARGRTRYRGGDHLFTTQLYFEPELIDRVHRAAEPYRRRTAHPAYPGIILGDEPGSSGLRMKAAFERGVVTAQMQLLIDAGRAG